MQIPWEDLALFCAVARHGALAPAARERGVSAATLSRRMTALEARMGRRLFLHGAQGYMPTVTGRALLERTERMEIAAAEIAQWQAAQDGPTRVRISAGTWSALHLAENIAQIWQPSAPWVPEFIHANIELDIARREIDIGVRNKRPEHPWLAGRSVGDVRFAAYGRDGAKGWIGATYDAAATASSAWLRAHHEAEIVTTANDPRLLLAMAEACIGKVVLPTFAGDARPSLKRQSDEIDELSHQRWLVCHHETRHEPGIRAALEAISAFLACLP
ncbi:MAG: LysR family transcriptional regulator [Rhodobacteraceae bacterium]|nr:LysR family transcriptional regulator [Paracoccaceae bacterium]